MCQAALCRLAGLKVQGVAQACLSKDRNRNFNRLPSYALEFWALQAHGKATPAQSSSWTQYSLPDRLLRSISQECDVRHVQLLQRSAFAQLDPHVSPAQSS